MDLYKRDGTYVPLNIASRSAYQERNETATSIAGTWFSPRSEFNAYLGGTSRWNLTDKGRTAASNPDPKATTQKDCIPVGAPALMFYPVANTITVQRDRVVMKVDWMEAERIVYLDGRKHPPTNQTFLRTRSPWCSLRNGQGSGSIDRRCVIRIRNAMSRSPANSFSSDCGVSTSVECERHVHQPPFTLNLQSHW